MITLSKAQDKGFGGGIIIGEPTGLSGKYWIDDSRALDFGIASSFVHTYTALSLHGDLIFHNYNVIKSEFRLPVYYGFGLRIHLNDKGGNTFGARGVMGIAWMLNNSPIDIFIEMAPVFNLFPETSLHLDLSLGGRYYFNTK
jgi:hypothetical protein